MSDGPELLIEGATHPTGRLVRVRGEVDMGSSPALRTQLMSLAAQKPKQVVLDLAGVTYMDSSGVGTLVELKRVLERGGSRLVLAGLQPRVRSIFEITQLDRFFLIVADAREAPAR